MSNNVIPFNNPNVPKTMSSLEISALTEKKHANVIRDIKTMVKDLLGDDSDLSHQGIQGVKEYKDNRGYTARFDLDYEHSMILITGYNVKLRAAVINRWMELEEKVAVPTFDAAKALNDPITLRQLLLQNVEKVLELESTVKEQAPKVAAFIRISESDGSVCITDAAKNLGIKPKSLFEYLAKEKWIYKRSSKSPWVGSETAIRKRFVEQKVITVNTGTGDTVREQVRVTPVGLTRIAADNAFGLI